MAPPEDPLSGQSVLYIDRHIVRMAFRGKIWHFFAYYASIPVYLLSVRLFHSPLVVTLILIYIAKSSYPLLFPVSRSDLVTITKT